ncbi:MAG: pilus assembly protein HicB [bacterium]|nr:pilus assembly protein HicB [bacterium]
MISLELPQSLKNAAARLAMENRVSLNQWTVPAVAQKIGAVETADDFLKARAGKAKRGDLTKLLDRAPDVPPMPEDAIKD